MADDAAAPLSSLSAALYLHGDVVSLAQVLTTTLADLLPADAVVVERHRSGADRIARRPGTPTAISVATADDRQLLLRTDARGGVRASVAHVVRGVRLSSRDVELAEWIALLAADLERQAAADERARAAVERFLLE